jgi:hypothetical protein
VAKRKASSPQRFRVVRGLNYPGGGGARRAEPGEVVDDLPAGSVPWLLAQGHITPVEDEGGEG